MTTVPGSCSWGLYDYCTGKKLQPVRKKQRITLYVKKKHLLCETPQSYSKKEISVWLDYPKNSRCIISSLCGCICLTDGLVSAFIKKLEENTFAI